MPPLEDTVARQLRLLVIDHRQLVGQGLVALLGQVRVADTVVLATSTEQALDLALRYCPQIALVDVSCSADAVGEVGHALAQQAPATRLLFLDDTLRPIRVQWALELGAWGYWTRHNAFADLAHGIGEIVRGQRSFCPELRRDLKCGPRGWEYRPAISGAPLARATPRELQVLDLLARGLSVREVAQRLSLSTNTIDNHKARLMRKLGLHKVVELVRVALGEGLGQ